MSVTPPQQGGPTDPSSSEVDPNAGPATAKWGTVTGGMRSPPPAPSSGAGVRRNHTIHGARQHGKPRLEKHFEQPEDSSASAPRSPDAAASGHSAPHSTRFNDDQPLYGLQASPSSSREASLAHSSSFSATAGNAAEFVPSLTPLQALYSKSGVSRNLSLPSRHTNKLTTTNLPSSATQGRTSQFNSLSAITGGSDLDDHDWEKLIHSSNALGDEHHQDPHALNSLSVRTDQPWSSSLFSTGQLGAPASSSHPTSPITGSGPFSEAAHLDGSVSGVDLFGDTQALGGSASFLRRHQSLNHHAGRSAGHRLAARSSDLRSRYAGDAADSATPSYPLQSDAAFSPVRHTTSFSATNSPVMPSGYSKAPWNQPPQEPIGSPSRFAGSFPSQSHDVPHNRLPSGFDGPTSSLADISQNLSNLDISGSSALVAGDDQDSITPTKHSLFPNSAAQSSSSGGADGQALGGRRLPQLVTSRDALQRGQRVNGASGPMSAAAFVPPIGHAHTRHQSNDLFAIEASTFDIEPSHRFGPFTAAPTGGWQDKDSIAGRFGDAALGGQAWPQQPHSTMNIDPNLMALSMALAQEQKRNAVLQAQLRARSNHSAGSPDPLFFGMQPIDLNGPMQSIGQQLRAGALPSSPPIGGIGNLPSRGQPFPMQQSTPSLRPPGMHAASPPSGPAPGPTLETGGATPVDATSLALQKGYNPPPGAFGPPPPTARFFVIKSYTEDDVHKSLKYEIWASTDKGNQRLDKAFRETAHTGPIYLFYSVNASGHFCGMAQMLTPLDYATSSNVWAQDGKWKGTFKVRWIYVKDLPNGQLRHIRLTNTPECKPVTQSRDTQELTPEAGREVWRIMSEYGAKTSLLQDFNFYEMQGRGATQQQQVGSPAMGLGRNSPNPGLTFPASPGARSASPNGARRGQQSGTPQRPHGVSGLGLTGTPRSGVRQINDLRGDGGGLNDTTAAQNAGLAPSAI